MSATPATYQRVLRSLPLWLLREYLVELGGVPSDGAAESATHLNGPGWQADLQQIEDFAVGSLVVGQVRLTVTAGEMVAEQLFPLLDQKLLRAGG
jgi:hypothetical protein